VKELEKEKEGNETIIWRRKRAEREREHVDVEGAKYVRACVYIFPSATIKFKSYCFSLITFKEAIVSHSLHLKNFSLKI